MSDKIQLSTEQVKQVAGLANLTLSESEVTTFQTQLSEVLSYIQQLQQVDTSKVESTAQVTGLQNITRSEDVEGTRTLPVAEAVSNATQTHNNYFVVPHILEERD